MYAVRLADFEGPLDLLLFFIRRDELDIHDIPIAQIADEYLAYVRVLDEVDLDGAGEFVYMAALLISIKAQMLLPRPAAEDGEEAFDPRKELVDRLLEYMRFKEAAGELAFQEGQRAALYARQSPVERKRYAGSDDFITYDYSVFQLVSALKRVLDRAADEEPESHVVQAESYSVEDQRTFVLDRVRAGGRHSFVALVKERPKPFIIATFLALLEMIRERVITVHIGDEGLSDFFVEATG